MSEILGDAVLELRTDDARYNRGLAGARKSLGGFGKILKTGALAGGVALAGLGVASIKMAADFEKSFAEVKTLLPSLSEEAFGKLQDDLLDFSKEMGIATDKAVPALYQAISAGVPPENVMTFMETAAKASIGGVTDLETAVDGITSVVNAYGEGVIDAQKASDIMFTGVRLGKTTFEELSASLFNVIPTAAATGVSFGDVAAQLAVITASGTPTSVATTQIRQALVEAQKSGTNLDLALRDLTGKGFAELIRSGKSMPEIFNDLRKSMPEQEFKDLFGSVEAMNAVLGVTGPNFDKVSAAMDEMANSSGATDAAFKVVSDTASFKFGKAVNELKIVLLELGLDALPAVTSALETVAPILQEKVAGAVRDLKDAFLEAKPIVIDFGKSFTSGLVWVKAFFNFIIDNKALLIASIAAIGVAIFLSLGPVSQAAIAITAFIVLLGVLRDHITEIKAFFAQNWQEIASIVSFAFLGPLGMVTVISTNAFGIREKMLGMLREIVPGWEAGWSTIGRILEAIWKGIVTVIETGINLVVDGIRQLFIGIKAAADAFPGPNPLGNAMQAAIDGLNAVTLSNIAGVAKNMWDMGRGAVAGFLAGFGGGGGGAGAGGALTGVGDLPSGLEPQFQQIGANAGAALVDGLGAGLTGAGGIGGTIGEALEEEEPVVVDAVWTFTQRVLDVLRDIRNTKAFGQAGADLMAALHTAIEVGGEANIRQVADIAGRIIKTLKTEMPPGLAEHFGDQLLAALTEAIKTGGQDSINAIEDILAQINDRLEEGFEEAIDIAQSFQEAFKVEMTRRDLIDAIGQTGIRLMDTLREALEEGGEASVGTLAKIAADLVETLESELSPKKAALLGAELMAALQAALEGGGEGALATLQDILAKIFELLEGIPEKINVPGITAAGQAGDPFAVETVPGAVRREPISRGGVLIGYRYLDAAGRVVAEDMFPSGGTRTTIVGFESDPGQLDIKSRFRFGGIPTLQAGGRVLRGGLAIVDTGETILPPRSAGAVPTVNIDLRGAQILGVPDLERKIVEAVTLAWRRGGLRFIGGEV